MGWCLILIDNVNHPVSHQEVLNALEGFEVGWLRR